MNTVTIITGASGDIGAAIALHLAAQGHTLILFGHKNAERLHAVASQCQSLGVHCQTFCGDVADESFLNSVTEQILSAYGRIDNLVHAAGISEIGLLGDLSLTVWNRLMQTNLTSAFLCAKCVTPSMVHAQSGRILLLSSVWGTRGASCEAAYSASKGGLESLAKALAKELAPSGIAVNALAPGMVNTKMNAAFSEEDIAAICEEIPAGRMASPEEVAMMTSLLLQAPTYLTGQVIGFNGGWF